MNCRLCGSENLYLYYHQGNDNEYDFYKCRNCKLVNYDLSGGLDQGKYSDQYFDPNDKRNKKNIDQAASYNYIKSKINTRGKLLDIGCGNGRLLLSAKQDGWDVCGLELSENFSNQIRERFGIKIINENFFEYEKGDEEYDFVVLRHVLEHLPNSVAAMSKINSLLKNDGFALFEFPHIESLEMKMKRFLVKRGLSKRSYGKSYVPGHCNEFCKKSFNYLLEKTGFKLLYWELYSSTHKLSGLLTRLNISSKARAIVQKVKNIQRV